MFLRLQERKSDLVSGCVERIHRIEGGSFFHAIGDGNIIGFGCCLGATKNRGGRDCSRGCRRCFELGEDKIKDCVPSFRWARSETSTGMQASVLTQ